MYAVGSLFLAFVLKCAVVSPPVPKCAKSAGPTRNPEFRIHRNRLQESSLAGKIDKREYARLLAEFRKLKKK
jgi:hypothetical protein